VALCVDRGKTGIWSSCILHQTYSGGTACSDRDIQKESCELSIHRSAPQRFRDFDCPEFASSIRMFQNLVRFGAYFVDRKPFILSDRRFSSHPLKALKGKYTEPPQTLAREKRSNFHFFSDLGHCVELVHVPRSCHSCLVSTVNVLSKSALTRSSFSNP
jgi:hypothetical protein